MVDTSTSESSSSSSSSQQERFSEMTRIMFEDRSLQDGFGGFTSAPTPAGGTGGFPVTSLAPTPAFGGGGFPITQPPAPSSNSSSQSNLQKSRPLIFLILILLVIFGIYRFYQTCKQRREQYLNRLRSVQADQVLGDMQMVPSEDPDAELL